MRLSDVFAGYVWPCVHMVNARDSGRNAEAMIDNHIAPWAVFIEGGNSVLCWMNLCKDSPVPEKST